MARNDLDKALHRAAYEGDLAKVLALLKAGANPNAKGEDGQYALHAAVAWFQLPFSDFFTRGPTKPSVLTALLDAGAELNAQDPKGQTALILACRNGNTAAAQLLLESGANARLTDKFGWSALTWHLWKHQWSLQKNDVLVALLRDQGCVLTLWDALYLEDDSLALRLVKTANARIRGPRRQTLLQLAALYGQVAVAEQLLARGAEVNAQDQQKRTALHFAMGGELAIGINANPGQKRFGKQSTRGKLVALLLHAGAKLDVRDDFLELGEPDVGKTPLEWAIAFQRADLAHLLLKAGANPNQAEEYGDPVLFLAVRQQNQALVKVLLDAGADPFAQDESKESALQSAQWHQNQAIFWMLLRAARRRPRGKR